MSELALSSVTRLSATGLRRLPMLLFLRSSQNDSFSATREGLYFQFWRAWTTYFLQILRNACRAETIELRQLLSVVSMAAHVGLFLCATRRPVSETFSARSALHSRGDGSESPRAGEAAEGSFRKGGPAAPTKADARGRGTTPSEDSGLRNEA